MTDRQVPSLDERRQVTKAIADWGRAARLNDQTAADIYAAIVATPAAAWADDEPDEQPDTPLGALWWRRQAAELAATMIRSTRWVPAA